VRQDREHLTPDDSTAPLGVIADDITGALDTGVQFAKAGLETVLLLAVGERSTIPVKPGQVHVRSTNSRDGGIETARHRAERAAELLRSKSLYKKIDSTMRGHTGTEIEAILNAARFARAVVCPAVISQGRIVREGQLYVQGRPLHASEFARDPIWPAKTSDMAGLLGVPATHLPLDTVRSGPESLAQAILGAPTSIVTVDTVEQADIQRVAGAAVLSRCLPCGALGLARAWIDCLLAAGFVTVPCTGSRSNRENRKGLERGARPLLIVAGSRHPVTRVQLRRATAARDLVEIEVMANDVSAQAKSWALMEAALAAERTVIVRSPFKEIHYASERRTLNETMAAWARRACQELTLGGLVLTGGETAQRVCRALGAMAIDILGELEPGIPWGRLAGGIVPGMPVVTKAGGFGRPDSLICVVDALQQTVQMPLVRSKGANP
jgi:uncharacterized protein YgbK (DUF1537 family)